MAFSRVVGADIGQLIQHARAQIWAGYASRTLCSLAYMKTCDKCRPENVDKILQDGSYVDPSIVQKMVCSKDTFVKIAPNLLVSGETILCKHNYGYIFSSVTHLANDIYRARIIGIFRVQLTNTVHAFPNGGVFFKFKNGILEKIYI